jgi:hypothetical protein
MYLEAGVRSFVLAWRIRDAAQLNRLRETLAMPLSVIRLEAPLEVIERRLASDPTTSRADDLAVAAADIATGDAALPAADATIDADQPVTVVAEAVLVHLGWATPH